MFTDSLGDSMSTPRMRLHVDDDVVFKDFEVVLFRRRSPLLSRPVLTTKLSMSQLHLPSETTDDIVVVDDDDHDDLGIDFPAPADVHDRLAPVTDVARRRSSAMP